MALFADFLQTGCLAGASSQEVELGAPHLVVAQHLDLLDARRVQQKRTLDADAMGGHASDGEAGTGGLVAAGHADHHALKDLNTLTAAFDNTGMHAHSVTDPQIRNVRVRVGL